MGEKRHALLCALRAPPPFAGPSSIKIIINEIKIEIIISIIIMAYDVAFMTLGSAACFCVVQAKNPGCRR